MLITDAYRRLNAELHAADPDYGTSGHTFAQRIEALAMSMGTSDVLDYGCGKQTLKRALPNWMRVRGYDPAIPGLDQTPDPADLVVCGDVLEHVEPDLLDPVLADIARLTKRQAFLVIATRPARKTLPDGRNAHLIVQPWRWWVDRLADHFDLTRFERIAALQISCTGEPIKAPAGASILSREAAHA